MNRIFPCALLLTMFLILTACTTASPNPTPPPPKPTISPQLIAQMDAVIERSANPKPIAIPTVAAATIQPAPTPIGRTNIQRLEEGPIGELHGTGEVQEFTGEAADLHREATGMLNRGEYAAAIANLEAMAELLDEPSFIVHNQLGLAYRWLRDSESSIRHLTIAIDLNDSSVARTNRATAYVYNGQCPEAVADANLALDREATESDSGYSSHIEARLLLSTCYAQSGEHALALNHIETAIGQAQSAGVREERLESFERIRLQVEGIATGDAYPEDIFAGYVLIDLNEGLEKFYGGEEREAVALFESALVEHGKPSSRIIVFLGRSHAALGEREKAFGYFSEAIELRDNAFNRTWRAIEYLAADDCDRAVPDAEIALGMKPYVEAGFDTRVESLWVRGLCQASWGLFNKALDDIGEAIQQAQASNYSPVQIQNMRSVYNEGMRTKSKRDSG